MDLNTILLALPPRLTTVQISLVAADPPLNVEIFKFT